VTKGVRPPKAAAKFASCSSCPRADVYEISVAPALASMKCTRSEEGMDAGRQLARRQITNSLLSAVLRD
jgi:hypothetical protein